MNEGDQVIVTNVNGETAEGTIEELTGQRADEYEFETGPVDTPKTIAEYWWGEIERDEYVIEVDLGSGVFAYPASKVEVVE